MNYEVHTLIETKNFDKFRPINQVYVVKDYNLKTGAYFSRFHVSSENYEPDDFNPCKDKITFINNNFSIHSIVRLDDGVLFTIGDLINTYGIIKRLRLTNDGQYQFSCQDKDGWVDLNNIPKHYHFNHQLSEGITVAMKPLSTDQYKVIAFYGSSLNKDVVYDVNDDKCFSPNGCSYPMSSINLEEHKIHTVERLSDGELFTIGDKIKCINNKYDQPINYMLNKEHIIHSFQDNNNKPLNSLETPQHKGLWVSTHHSGELDWIPFGCISKIRSTNNKPLKSLFIEDCEQVINPFRIINKKLLLLL